MSTNNSNIISRCVCKDGYDKLSTEELIELLRSKDRQIDLMAQWVNKAHRLEVKVRDLKKQLNNTKTELLSMTERAKETEAILLQVNKLTSKIVS